MNARDELNKKINLINDKLIDFRSKISERNYRTSEDEVFLLITDIEELCYQLNFINGYLKKY